MADCMVLRCASPYSDRHSIILGEMPIDVGLRAEHVQRIDQGDEWVYDYEENVVLFAGDVAALGHLVSGFSMKTVWWMKKTEVVPGVQLELRTANDDVTVVLPLSFAPGLISALTRRLPKNPSTTE